MRLNSAMTVGLPVAGRALTVDSRIELNDDGTRTGRLSRVGVAATVCNTRGLTEMKPGKISAIEEGLDCV